MDSATFWRLLLIAVVVYIGIRLVLWLLHMVMGILSFAIVVAVVVGVIWLLFNLFARRRAY